MTVAVIPAYNEEKTIGEILEKVKLFVNKIIVVNDGSKDKTAEMAGQCGVQVINHIINRGLGAALRTGFSAAARENADIIITLDADGQHNPEDIPKLIAPIKNNEADAVIGSRFILEKHNSRHSECSEESRGSAATHEINVGRRIASSARSFGQYPQDDVPIFRRFANFAGNLTTFLLFGIWVSDSQSGFRAFSQKALLKINLKSSGMEVSSEIIKEIKRNHLRLKEIPIKPVYTKYSMSKGQNLLEGARTLFQLILRRLE